MGKRAGQQGECISELDPISRSRAALINDPAMATRGALGCHSSPSHPDRWRQQQEMLLEGREPGGALGSLWLHAECCYFACTSPRWQAGS